MEGIPLYFALLRAFEIARIEYHEDGTATLVHIHEAPYIRVTQDYLERFRPVAGGIYLSPIRGIPGYLPKDVFESAFRLSKKQILYYRLP